MPAPLIGLALGALRAVAGRAIAATAGTALRAGVARGTAGAAQRAGQRIAIGGKQQYTRARQMQRGAAAPSAAARNVTTNNYTSTTIQNSNNSSTNTAVNTSIAAQRQRRTDGILERTSDGTSRPTRTFDPNITKLNERDVITRLGQSIAGFVPMIGEQFAKLVRFTNDHYAFVKAQKLGQYSGLVAVADAQIEVGNIQRRIGRAKYTSESEYRMTIARDRLEQAKEPFRAVYQKGMNVVTTAMDNLQATAYEQVGNTLGDMADKETTTGILTSLAKSGIFGTSAQLMGMGGEMVGKEINKAKDAQSNLDLLQQSFLGDMAHPTKDDKAQEAAKKYSRNVGQPGGPARTLGGY